MKELNSWANELEKNPRFGERELKEAEIRLARANELWTAIPKKHNECKAIQKFIIDSTYGGK